MGKKSKKEWVVDASGNKVEKGSRTDPEMVAARAAAAARREAKAAAAAAAAAAEAGGEDASAGGTDVEGLQKLPHPVTLGGGSTETDGVPMAASTEGGEGKKLTRKERKRLEREAKLAAEASAEADAKDDVLSQFHLSFAGSGGGGGGGGADGDDDEEGPLHPSDIVVPSFSIAAPGAKALLTDASLRLRKGRRYALVGNNGSGKSTLLRFLAQRPCRLPVPKALDLLLVEQETAASDVPIVQQVLSADTARAALIAEQQKLWAAIGADDAAGDDGSSAGGSESAGWTDEEWAKALERLGEIGKQLLDIKADAAEAEVCKILSGLGFTREMQAKGTTTLSGGWRMRVSLARALFRQPAVLLLDEPTNHLDLNAVLWLEDYLSTSFGGTLLCVSHDADFLDTVCTDVIELDSQQLTNFSGPTPGVVYRFLSGRESRVAKRTKDYETQEKTIKKSLNKGQPRKVAEKAALKEIKRNVLLEKPRPYRVDFTFKDPEDDRPTAAVLGAGFAHPGSPPLFANLSFDVGTHSRIAVVGVNGAGKTTLLQLLTGQLAPTSGEIHIDRKLKVGRFDQHFEELLPMGKTPVAFLRSEYGLEDHEARKALGQFGLDGPRHLIPIGELSGGQKARVVFASLSHQRPHVLILDEPTNHLDMESVEALVAGVKEFAGGVVLVSHDARLIVDTECEVWVCEGAEDVAAGATGLRIETKGFEKYRQDMLRGVLQAALEEERRVLRQAEADRKKAAERMARLGSLRKQ